MVMLLPEQWKSFVTMVIGKVNVIPMEIPFCPSNQKGHLHDSGLPCCHGNENGKNPCCQIVGIIIVRTVTVECLEWDIVIPS